MAPVMSTDQNMQYEMLIAFNYIVKNKGRRKLYDVQARKKEKVLLDKTRKEKLKRTVCNNMKYHL